MTKVPYVDHMASTTATDLAESILADGFDAHRVALSTLFADARRRGVSSVLIDVAADSAEAVVVRQRALGRILGTLARPARDDDVPLPEADAA